MRCVCEWKSAASTVSSETVSDAIGRGRNAAAAYVTSIAPSSTPAPTISRRTSGLVLDAISRQTAYTPMIHRTTEMCCGIVSSVIVSRIAESGASVM